MSERAAAVPESEPKSKSEPSADAPTWTAPWVAPADPPASAAVVGGGAVGATAARDLAAAGVDVTLFEAGDAVGAGSSGRAAGIVYNAFAEDVDAELARRALARFRALDAADVDFHFTDCPYVMLAREGDDECVAAVEAAAAGMARNGVAVETVDGDELSGRVPLSGDDVAVAAICSGAGHCNPGSYVAAMAAAARRAGATIRTDAPVRVRTDPVGVAVDGSGPGADADVPDPVVTRYDAVLVACGAWTGRVLADAGVPVALKPYRVQALTAGRPYDGPMAYDATAGAYFRPHPTGLLAGDGTVPEAVDPDAYDRTADDWFVEDVDALLAHRAGYDLAVERAWAGVCTATPDRDPLLGELRDGLYVAAGWQGHGFMRAPATAEAVVAEMVGGDGVAPFDPTRVDGDESFAVVEGMTPEERAE
ncbi:MAG: NAD(P)/FAD-dependent oxidoreductase [Halolamina sp.]